MNRKFLSVIALSIMTLASCTNKEQAATENPFLSDYGTPYEVPAFDKIKTEHYLPAFEEGMKQQKAEVDFIVKNRAMPDFENTILAYDKSGELLDKVANIFMNLTECMSNDEMQKIAAEILPKLSAHSDEIAMNPLLFEKVKQVYDTRHDRNLDDQQIRVVEKYYADFIRNGAGLNDADKAALKEINGKLAKLSNDFGNNLLAENAAFKLVVDNVKTHLPSMPSFFACSAAATMLDCGSPLKSASLSTTSLNDEFSARRLLPNWKLNNDNFSLMPFNVSLSASFKPAPLRMKSV